MAAQDGKGQRSPHTLHWWAAEVADALSEGAYRQRRDQLKYEGADSGMLFYSFIVPPGWQVRQLIQLNEGDHDMLFLDMLVPDVPCVPQNYVRLVGLPVNGAIRIPSGYVEKGTLGQFTSFALGSLTDFKLYPMLERRAIDADFDPDTDNEEHFGGSDA